VPDADDLLDRLYVLAIARNGHLGFWERRAGLEASLKRKRISTGCPMPTTGRRGGVAVAMTKRPVFHYCQSGHQRWRRRPMVTTSAEIRASCRTLRSSEILLSGLSSTEPSRAAQ
jgi:hypothetical protein